jgi:hypothetical protein
MSDEIIDLFRQVDKNGNKGKDENREEKCFQKFFNDI